MKKEAEKKTAIKWLNKYADEYNGIWKQNSILQNEIKDLYSNWQINKDIIQSFFKGGKFEPKCSFLFKQQKEEILQLLQKNKQLLKDNLDLHGKINEITQISNTKIDKWTDDNEKLKTKIFLYHNIILEKESLLCSYKNKTLGSAKTPSTGRWNNILYITEPTAAVTIINDELLWYKEITKKYSKHIKELKYSLDKSERTIHAYEIDILRFKQQWKEYNLKFNIDNRYIDINTWNPVPTNKSANNISLPTHERLGLNLTRNYSGNNMNLSATRSQYKHNLIKRLEDFEEVNRENKSKFDMTEEWYDTLRHCNMTQEEFLRFCKVKSMVKWCDVIEYWYKILIDKNIQIKWLQQETDCLNSDNWKLNKKNIELNEELESALISGTKGGGNSLNVSVNTNITNWCNVTSMTMRKVSELGIHHQDKNMSGNFRVEGSTNNTNKEAETIVEEMRMKEYERNVRESVTSSEFAHGIALDQFELESEMSQRKHESERSNNSNWDEINISIH